MTIGVFLSLVLVGSTCLFLYIYNLFWWKPLRLRKKLQHQGIHGPVPSFFFGNIPDIKKIRLETQATKNQESIGDRVSHDYLSHLYPHIEKWRADFGKYIFLLLQSTSTSLRLGVFPRYVCNMCRLILLCNKHI